MEEKSSFPSVSNLSVLTAVVVMVYVFLPLFPQELKPLQFNLFNIAFKFPVDFGSLMSIIAAILSSAGVDWLLEAHPYADQRRRLLHWVLPGLTAWAIGVPLSQLTMGAGWWIVLALGVLLLLSVIICEYITVDSDDKRYYFASIALMAVTFALYMIFTVAINGMGTRLYFLIMAIIPFSLLAALRVLSLRLIGRRNRGWAIVISLILGQLAFGLHYFPVSAIQFGLILTGSLYVLTNVAVFIEKKEKWGISWIVPFLVFAVFIMIAWMIRL